MGYGVGTSRPCSVRFEAQSRWYRVCRDAAETITTIKTDLAAARAQGDEDEELWLGQALTACMRVMRRVDE